MCCLRACTQAVESCLAKIPGQAMCQLYQTGATIKSNRTLIRIPETGQPSSDSLCLIYSLTLHHDYFRPFPPPGFFNSFLSLSPLSQICSPTVLHRKCLTGGNFIKPSTPLNSHLLHFLPPATLECDRPLQSQSLYLDLDLISQTSQNTHALNYPFSLCLQCLPPIGFCHQFFKCSGFCHLKEDNSQPHCPYALSCCFLSTNTLLQRVCLHSQTTFFSYQFPLL